MHVSSFPTFLKGNRINTSSEKQVAGQLIDKLPFQYVHNEMFGHMNTFVFLFVLCISSNKYLRWSKMLLI